VLRYLTCYTGVSAWFFRNQMMDYLAALLKKGKLKSHVSQSFTFHLMADAHQQIESGRTVEDQNPELMIRGCRSRWVEAL